MKKILVVEDDKFLMSTYRLKLQAADFETKFASNGEEALEILNNFKPDLILLDLIMPIKDGFSTLEEIKANPVLSKIPVVVASNLGQPEDISKSKKLGALDYIVKRDVTLSDLINKIKKYL